MSASAGAHPDYGPRHHVGGRTRDGCHCLRLIGDPEFLATDEPSPGLSPKLIDEYFDTVARINALGETVLLIEQNAEKALSISDRAYLIVRGRIEIEGTREALLGHNTIRRMYL